MVKVEGLVPLKLDPHTVACGRDALDLVSKDELGDIVGQAGDNVAGSRFDPSNPGEEEPSRKWFRKKGKLISFACTQTVTFSLWVVFSH